MPLIDQSIHLRPYCNTIEGTHHGVLETAGHLLTAGCVPVNCFLQVRLCPTKQPHVSHPKPSAPASASGPPATKPFRPDPRHTRLSVGRSLAARPRLILAFRPRLRGNRPAPGAKGRSIRAAPRPRAI